MEQKNEPFIQKPLSARTAAIALLLLLLPFAGVFLFLMLEGHLESGAAVTARLDNSAFTKLAALIFALLTLDFVLFYLFFRHIFRRLRESARVIAALAAGQYTETLPAGSPDEIGALCAAVNQLSARLSAEETRRVYKTPGPNVRYTPLDEGGESRFVSVMSAEIDGWNEKAYLVSGKRLIALLAKYYEIVSACARKTGGILESHSASRAVLIWGGLEKRGEPERDAYNALRCALLIRHAAYQYNCRQKNKDLRVKINMGLHSGAVTAGLVKVNETPELKVTGSNLEAAAGASRLGRDHHFDILMTAASYELTENHTITEPFEYSGGGAERKGVVYALVNIKSGSRRYQKHPRSVSDVRKIMKWKENEV